MSAGVFRCPACGGLNRVAEGRAGPKCGRCHAALPVDGAVAHVTDEELDQLLASSPVPVLVDFYADWCQPCRMLSPVLAQLAQRHAGEIVVVKVDTERHQRNAGRLRVEGIPAVFLFRGGQVVGQASGFRPLGAWEQLVRPHLSAA